MDKTQPYIKCKYLECTSTSANAKIITLSEDTKTNFSTELDALCETHYQVMYRQSHQYNQCASCVLASYHPYSKHLRLAKQRLPL